MNSQLQPYHTELAGERSRINLNEPELASADHRSHMHSQQQQEIWVWAIFIVEIHNGHLKLKFRLTSVSLQCHQVAWSIGRYGIIIYMNIVWPLCIGQLAEVSNDLCSCNGHFAYSRISCAMQAGVLIKQRNNVFLQKSNQPRADGSSTNFEVCIKKGERWLEFHNWYGLDRRTWWTGACKYSMCECSRRYLIFKEKPFNVVGYILDSCKQ